MVSPEISCREDLGRWDGTRQARTWGARRTGLNQAITEAGSAIVTAESINFNCQKVNNYMILL